MDGETIAGLVGSLIFALVLDVCFFGGLGFVAWLIVLFYVLSKAS